ATSRSDYSTLRSLFRGPSFPAQIATRDSDGSRSVQAVVLPSCFLCAFPRRALRGIRNNRRYIEPHSLDRGGCPSISNHKFVPWADNGRGLAETSSSSPTNTARPRARFLLAPPGR